MMTHPFTGNPISIAATATAVPLHTLTREDVKTYMPRVFDVGARRLSVELPTLTFQRDDLSQANLISCVLFGDGAAAALVTGRPSMGPGIVGAETYTFPASIDAMGFQLTQQRIPHRAVQRDPTHDPQKGSRAGR